MSRQIKGRKHKVNRQHKEIKLDLRFVFIKVFHTVMINEKETTKTTFYNWSFILCFFYLVFWCHVNWQTVLQKRLQNHCKRAAAHLTLFELWLMNFNEQLLDFMIFLSLQQHWLSETSAYDEETRKQLLNKNKRASFCFTESRGDFIVFLSYIRDWGEL